MKKSFWVSLTLSAALVIFSVLNAGTVSVNFIFKEVEISLAILLIIVFLSGVIAGASYFYIRSKQKDKPSKADKKAQPEVKTDNAEE